MALVVIGRGGGGVNEMQDLLDDTKVLFGMVRFTFGSGTFKRDKFIFVHFNGEAVGAVKRGRWNSKRGDIQQLLGSTHANLELNQTDQCNVDYVFEKLNSVFVSDHGDHSIGDLKKEYERLVEEQAKAAKEAEGADDEEEEPGSPKRKTAAELEEEIPAEKVLKAIRQPTGPFNWALFEASAKLDLLDAGSLSVPEMCERLVEDKVLFGIVRMAFGTGAFRRTKWVFVHWVGPKTGVVKKGKAGQLSGEMKSKLGPYAASIETSDAEDLELGAFIKRVAKSFIVDECKDEKKAKKEEAFGMEEFLEALKEEQEESAEFFGDNEEPASPKKEKPEEVTYPLDETLKMIRNSEAPINWLLGRLP